MAVGGMGMLSTSNYAARKFGVRAAMPGFIAKKLCPNLVIVPSNMEKYAQVSEIVRGVFREYDPNFAPMSLDEAYLDITDIITSSDSAWNIVQEMRSKIQERTKLTASAGRMIIILFTWHKLFVYGRHRPQLFPSKDMQ